MEELAQWYLMGSNAPAHLDSWERIASVSFINILSIQFIFFLDQLNCCCYFKRKNTPCLQLRFKNKGYLTSFNLQLEVNANLILVEMEEHVTTQDRVTNARAQEDSEEKTAKVFFNSNLYYVINLRSILITSYYFEAVSSGPPTLPYRHQGPAMNPYISLEVMSSCFVPSSYQHCLAKCLYRGVRKERHLTAHPQACTLNRPQEKLSLNAELNKAYCFIFINETHDLTFRHRLLYLFLLLFQNRTSVTQILAEMEELALASTKEKDSNALVGRATRAKIVKVRC